MSLVKYLIFSRFRLATILTFLFLGMCFRLSLKLISKITSFVLGRIKALFTFEEKAIAVEYDPQTNVKMIAYHPRKANKIIIPAIIGFLSLSVISYTSYKYINSNQSITKTVESIKKDHKKLKRVSKSNNKIKEILKPNHATGKVVRAKEFGGEGMYIKVHNKW